MLITRVISYGTDILLVFLAVYLFSFYFDIFFIRKKGKTVLITGYITFTAWQLIISNVSAWPVYVNICITTIVTFVSVMTAYEGEFLNKCIFAFVFNAIWMMIETLSGYVLLSYCEYSNAIVHAFQGFRAPFSGKIVHIFPEQSAAFN